MRGTWISSAQRGVAACVLGELVVGRQAGAVGDHLAQQVGLAAQHVGEGVDDDARLACRRRQAARDDAVIGNLDQRRRALRHGLAYLRRVAGLEAGFNLAPARGAQVDVEGEEIVRFDRQRVEKCQRREPVLGQPVRLAKLRGKLLDGFLAAIG